MRGVRIITVSLSAVVVVAGVSAWVVGYMEPIGLTLPIDGKVGYSVQSKDGTFSFARFTLAMAERHGMGGIDPALIYPEVVEDELWGFLDIGFHSIEFDLSNRVLIEKRTGVMFHVSNRYVAIAAAKFPCWLGILVLAGIPPLIGWLAGAFERQGPAKAVAPTNAAGETSRRA